MSVCALGSTPITAPSTARWQLHRSCAPAALPKATYAIPAMMPIWIDQHEPADRTVSLNFPI